MYIGYDDEEGLSILTVDMKKTPGIRVDPSEHDINAVFFDDVRTPVSNRVGAENKGWKLITGQLKRERMTLCSAGILERAFAQTRDFARESRLADAMLLVDPKAPSVRMTPLVTTAGWPEARVDLGNLLAEEG